MGWALSSQNTGKYQFRDMTMYFLRCCEPVIAGEGVFIWVSKEGITMSEGKKVSASFYHIDSGTQVDQFCTKRIDNLWLA